MRLVVKLKRTQLLEASGPVRLDAEASQLRIDDFATVVSETCPVDLNITHGGPEIRIKGQVTVRLEETCDRCLNTYEHNVTGRFSLILAEKESLYTDEMDEVYPFPPTQVEFDLGPFIRDAVQLERPMKHLCKEECKGLCPTCGADRNKIDCGCVRVTVDERWAPLKALRF